MAPQLSATFLLAAMIVAGACLVPVRMRAAVLAEEQIRSYTSRVPADDLEITGIARESPRYIRYTELDRLARVTKTIDGGPEFNNVTTRVSGIFLEDLQRALRVPASLDLMDALCIDRYRSQSPAKYVAQHHTILVLRVDGLEPAAKVHQDDPGSYFVVYAGFVPAFHVLAHADKRALPTNVVRINFSTEAKTFGPVTPPSPFAAQVQVQQCFVIAKQNYMRCHFRGEAGGTKSDRDWLWLSRVARDKPEWFSRYIVNPQRVEAQARMPANPQYDEATTAALTAYFGPSAESDVRI